MLRFNAALLQGAYGENEKERGTERMRGREREGGGRKRAEGNMRSQRIYFTFVQKLVFQEVSES